MLYAVAMNLSSLLFGAAVLGLVILGVTIGFYVILPMLASGQARLDRQRRESLRQAERNRIAQSDLPPATKKNRKELL